MSLFETLAKIEDRRQTLLRQLDALDAEEAEVVRKLDMQGALPVRSVYARVEVVL